MTHGAARVSCASRRKARAMKYKARFVGRKLGAIGIFYPIETVVEAETMQAAKLKLCDSYEHIQGLAFTEIKEPTC